MKLFAGGRPVEHFFLLHIPDLKFHLRLAETEMSRLLTAQKVDFYAILPPISYVKH